MQGLEVRQQNGHASSDGSCETAEKVASAVRRLWSNFADGAAPDRSSWASSTNREGRNQWLRANTKGSLRAVKYAVWAAIIAASLEAHWIWEFTVPWSGEGLLYYAGRFGTVIVVAALIGALVSWYLVLAVESHRPTVA
jgi:hypothetical protein